MKIITTILLIFISTITFAQGGAMADLKFEEAETAFNNQNYETTIKKLDEFDKLLGSVKDKSLYLRIISQDKLFEKLFYIAKVGVQIKNHKEGILVTNIVENSAAFKSGLEENDIILKLNEIKISNTEEFIENVKYKNEGNKIYIQLLRGEELIDKTLFVELSKDVKDENKIYFDDKNFDFLTKFRKNTNAYLKAMESSGLDERYREIYAIHEKLEKYPKDKASWLKEMQKAIDKSFTLIESAKELDTYYHDLALKIDAWYWSEAIKTGDHIENLYEQYPDVYKNLKKSGKSYFNTEKKSLPKLVYIRAKNDLIFEFNVLYADVLYKNEEEKKLEIRKVKKYFKSIFGESLIFTDDYEYNHSFSIDSPYSKYKIEVTGLVTIDITKKIKP